MRTPLQPNSKQASKQAGRQACKQASKQAGKQASKQASLGRNKAQKAAKRPDLNEAEIAKMEPSRQRTIDEGMWGRNGPGLIATSFMEAAG